MRSVQQTIAALMRQVTGGLKGHQQSHHMGRTINDRGVHHHPLSRLAGLHQPRQDTDHQIQRPAPDIANQCRRRHRRLTNRATVPQRARSGDIVQIMPRRFGQRPCLAPARHPTVHNVRCAGMDHIWAQTQFLHNTRTEPFDQGIRLTDQIQSNSNIIRIFQIQCDGFLAAIQWGFWCRCGGAGIVGAMDHDDFGT